MDVCYLSDMLVNMIAGDSQQIGALILRQLIKGETIPWSFELFSLGLDIILPKMGKENLKVSG